MTTPLKVTFLNVSKCWQVGWEGKLWAQFPSCALKGTESVSSLSLLPFLLAGDAEDGRHLSNRERAWVSDSLHSDCSWERQKSRLCSRHWDFDLCYSSWNCVRFHALEPGLANIFCKGPETQYFKLYKVLFSVTITGFWARKQPQAVNHWMGVLISQ